MKTSITFVLLFLFSICFDGMLSAQVTLNQSDFPRPTAFEDSLIIPTQSVGTLPSEGAAQTWDYSSWTPDIRSSTFYFDASSTSNPNFTAAYNVRTSDLVFAGLLISSDLYHGLDNNGWYLYGRTLNAADYSLTAVSGGANDSLHFLQYDDIYSGRTDFVPFPVTYQTQLSQSREETIPFEITVAAFGLNRTSGFRKRIVRRDLDVVGYGTLVMPTATGTSSAPFDVLLFKTVRTQTDSFFLGGSPAPATLLGALGITQGETAMDSFYNFYAPNYGANILGMLDDGGTGSLLFYRTQAIDAILAITDIQVSESNCFPNPVQQQQTLTIQTNKNIGSTNLTIVDVNGRVVFQEMLDNVQDTQYQWALPATLGQGIYFYQLIDQENKHQTQGQFQVH